MLIKLILILNFYISFFLKYNDKNIYYFLIIKKLIKLKLKNKIKTFKNIIFQVLNFFIYKFLSF